MILDISNPFQFLSFLQDRLGLILVYEARATGEVNITGISTDGTDEVPLTAQQEADINQAAADHASLAASTDKSTITADGQDTATITYNDTFGDNTIEHIVWQGLKVYQAAQATDISGDGQLVIELSTLARGTYTIGIFRQAPNFESVYIEIEAQ